MLATLKNAGRSVVDVINRFDDLSGKQKLFWLAVAVLVYLLWPEWELGKPSRHYTFCKAMEFEPPECEDYYRDEPQFGRY